MFRPTLTKLYWLLSSQFGIDPRMLLRSFRGLPVYAHELSVFRKGYKGTLELKPCLHDRYEEGGTTKSEYFWQDLLVARAIYEAKPLKHVDIGSRVDGFVAHVASFREIEVLDVRRISTAVPGVVFRKADLMDPASLPDTSGGGYCDSVSCLHTIEHFGLGRYGDPINPDGYKNGIANMAQLLKPGGTYYLSTPIGQERVEFNANWVFDPCTIIRCANEAGLCLQSLIAITATHGPQECRFDPEGLAELRAHRYSLGLFTFKKSR